MRLMLTIAALAGRAQGRDVSGVRAGSLEALFPLLGKCLGKRSEMRRNLFVVRGTLALNLYRLARVPRVAIAGRVQ